MPQKKKPKVKTRAQLEAKIETLQELINDQRTGAELARTREKLSDAIADVSHLQRAINARAAGEASWQKKAERLMIENEAILQGRKPDEQFEQEIGEGHQSQLKSRHELVSCCIWKPKPRWWQFWK